MLVGDIANDFFENVFERHQALDDFAVLIQTMRANGGLRGRNAGSCSDSGRRSGTNHGGFWIALLKIDSRGVAMGCLDRAQDVRACTTPMMFSGLLL